MALSEDQAVATVQTLLALREGEQGRLDRIAAYVRGDHDSVYVPKGARQEYRWMIGRSKVNMLRLVVAVLAQNLYVDGYRREKESDDAAPWAAWQANRLDARQHGIHRAALKYGISYALVLPGEPHPVVTPMSPRRMTAYYADCTNDEWPMFAIEVTPEQIFDGSKLVTKHMVRLFDATTVYSFVGDEKDRAPRLIGTEEHGLGICPVVRYCNEADLDADESVAGEVEPLMVLQDQANSTTFNLLMAQQYAAFRQRWVTGMAVPYDENGNPHEPLRAAVDRLWVGEEPTTKFGEFGEPLALDTPVPTPAGWTTMGEIKADDMIFGRDGRSARVIGMSPVLVGRPCYTVKFADGTSVVTDADHKWLVKDRFRPSWGEMVCTTAEMSHQVRLGGVRDGWRWAVPQAEPLELKPAELPIDPYLFGYWLGDGNASGATLTLGDHDREHVSNEVEALGYRVVSQKQDARTGAWNLIFNTANSDTERTCTLSGCDKKHKGYGLCNTHYTYAKNHGQLTDAVGGHAGVQPALRGLGVLHNKHIPAIYLRASFEQRLSLLQGLMDSDGSVNVLKSAQWCTYSSIRPDLTDGALELMRSLGLRPTVRWDEGKTRLMPQGALFVGGGIYTIGFQAPGDFVPFRMKRKAELCPTKEKSARQQYRSIVAIEEVSSVPVRCLAVDTEDHLFLVGEGFVPTHNTSLDGYLKSREETIRQMATISQTPPYYLLGAVANLSADALVAARDGLDRKTGERQSTFGEAHEQVCRAIGKASGDDAAWKDTDAQVVWRDTSTRSLAATVDALGKLTQQLGIPATCLWERIPGVTSQDIERWKATAQQEDSLNQLGSLLDKHLGSQEEKTTVTPADPANPPSPRPTKPPLR